MRLIRWGCVKGAVVTVVLRKAVEATDPRVVEVSLLIKHTGELLDEITNPPRHSHRFGFRWWDLRRPRVGGLAVYLKTDSCPLRRGTTAFG